MKFKKLTINLALAAVLAAAQLVTFTSCKSNALEESELKHGKATNGAIIQNEEIELSYWNSFTGPDGKYMQDIVDGFNQQYKSKICVDTKVIGADEYYRRLLPAVASGTAPDVGIMHISRMPQFAAKGILMPMDDLIKKLNLSQSNFIPSIWKAGLYNGKRYAIPIDVHPIGLYYNVDLLKAAGFDMPPENMQDFLKMAKACTRDLDGDGKPDQWGFAVDPSVMSQQLFWSLLYQYGGKALSDDGSMPQYDSAEGVKALTFMSDLIYKYKVSPANLMPDGELTLFKQKKLAFYTNGVWMISELRDQKDLNFATAPLPRFGIKDAVWADSHNLVMFRQRNYITERVAAAGNFINYLSQHSFEWAKAGQVPARNSIRNSMEFKSLKDQAGFAQQVNNMVFPVSSENYNLIWSPVGEHITDVLIGRTKPAEALKEAAEKARLDISANK